ncbi:uncharacterized protein LOC111055013 [Nilaparvata lugens]|uniref:uncharacterized protein LOC111055013 n=1 Tax=Nilaparvata lugens TaxID=108931 RepID=UPI00193D4DF9|nr:uncharacterized protein LOC111055013 [Nilaparvata lugens]
MTLRLPQFGESLCGCTLKSATKLIGWILLVLSIFILWILIIMILDNNTILISVIFGIDLIEETRCYGRDQCYTETRTVAPSFVKPLTLFIATSLMISSILNSLLLVGVYNNRPKFINAWIVALMVVIAVDLITLLSSVIAEPYNPVLRLGILNINVYCLLLVNSYHQTMKQGRIIAAPLPAYDN